MKILFATGHPYLPQISGGSQSSTDELAREFQSRGHTVAVAAGLSGAGSFALKRRFHMKMTGRSVCCDTGLGYPVYRSWWSWETLAAVAREFVPDVVFAQSGFPMRIGITCEALHLPCVIYLRNAELDDLGGSPAQLKATRYIANSQFTAGWFEERFAISSTVVHPLVQADRYRTVTSRSNVTFINPHPHKGGMLALEIARLCPDIPFRFIEAWPLDKAIAAELKKAMRGLPNVTLRARTSNMKDVYGEARIVLAPSKWNEGFGRIAAEAHVSGIPVIAMRRGGLPEAVGPGGVLMDPAASTESWAAEVQRLWSDEAHWRALSAAALDYSGRSALDRDYQISSIEEVLCNASRASRITAGS